jgi:hypothetical protein
VIIIDETMAKRFWTADTAIGKRIVCGPGAGFNRRGELEIVGVVRAALITSLSQADVTIYQPLSGRTLPHVLFKTADRQSAELATAAATRIDSRLRTRVKPLADNLERRLRASRAAAFAAGSLGLLALVLATVGLFGVFAWVQQRTHEIGIRLALGAGRMNIVTLVFRSSGIALAAGLVLGAAGTASRATMRLRGSRFKVHGQGSRFARTLNREPRTLNLEP